MARWMEPTEDQVLEYEWWLHNLPPHVREVARRFPPWELFLYSESNHRVTPYEVYEVEDGEVLLVVTVSGEFNRVTFGRNVFGIDPKHLTPCDLPPEGEPLGELMTQDEAREALSALSAGPGPIEVRAGQMGH